MAGNNNRRTRSNTRFACLLVCAVVHCPAFAAMSEPPEEIIISGHKTLASLRQDRDQALKHAFDLFNQANDERIFAIDCYYDAPTGTRFTEYSCKPVFVREVMARHAIAFIAGVGTVEPGGGVTRGPGANVSMPLQAELEIYLPKLRQKMENLSKTNLEFRDAMVKYELLREEYDQRNGPAGN